MTRITKQEMTALQAAGLFTPEMVEAIINTRGAMANNYLEVNEARKNYEAQLRLIDEARVKIQKNCTHPLQSHHPDPAGARGYTECDVCGKEL
jgi:hypothetical protein